MIKLSDVTSVLGFHLENDSSVEVREEGRQITRLSIILCPSAVRKLDIDPELLLQDGIFELPGENDTDL